MLKEFLQDQSITNQPLKAIYKFIYENGSVSRADIIKATELNRTKVAHLIEDLMNRGYIHYSGYGEPNGGRPPSLYQVNATCSYTIGIQINRIHTSIILFDLLFNKIDTKIFTMTPKHVPQVVIDEIKKTIRHFMEKYSFSLDELLGIGVGSIGPLDRKNGVILNPEPPLGTDWYNVPVVDMIKEEFPVTILLENGANAIILGEFKNLKGIYNNLVNVTVGWAWGCGVITEGNLVEVKSGDVSGYGHVVIDIDGKECSCGKKGCIVNYTSLYGVLSDIKAKNPTLYNKYKENAENETIEKVMDFLLIQDKQIEESILKSAKYLGLGIANMVNTLHSEFVIINGPLIDYYPGYYETIVKSAKLYINAKEKVHIKKGKYEGESAVTGVAVHVFETIFNSH